MIQESLKKAIIMQGKIFLVEGFLERRMVEADLLGLGGLPFNPEEAKFGSDLDKEITKRWIKNKIFDGCNAYVLGQSFDKMIYWNKPEGGRVPVGEDRYFPILYLKIKDNELKEGRD